MKTEDNSFWRGLEEFGAILNSAIFGKNLVLIKTKTIVFQSSAHHCELIINYFQQIITLN